MDDSSPTWAAAATLGGGEGRGGDAAAGPPLSAPHSPSQPLYQHHPRIRKRRRPAVACVRCRRRKIKCDRELPCTNCRDGKGNVECKYDPDGNVVYANAATTAAAAPGRRTKKGGPSSVNNNEGSSSTTTTATWSPASVATPRSNQGHQLEYRTAPVPGVHNPHSSTNPNGDGDDLMKRVDRLEGLLASRTRPSSLGPATSQSGVREVINKTRFFGRSHWANTFQQFNAAAQLDWLGYFQDQGLFNILGQCKALARDLKALRLGRALFLSTDIAALIPSRETGDRLVNFYFRSFESTHRILHIPSFYRENAQFWTDARNGIIDQTFAIKLFLVMSIGACFDTDESSRLRAPKWIAIATSWLGASAEKSRLNLSVVQIYCLYILSKQFHNISGDLTWIPAGSLLRVAMAMGFYRDPKYFPQMSVFQAEIRRRLWATALDLDIQSSLDAGMPPLISVDDFDCEAPANIDDTDIDEDTKEAPKSKPHNVFTQCSAQLALLQSIKTRLAITRLVNSFHRERTDEEVMSLTEQLTTQIRAQSRQFESFASQQPSNLTGWVPTNFHQILLDVLTRRFLLSLLLPYSVSDKVEPRHFYFRKLAVDCAMIFVAYLDDYLPDNVVDDSFCLRVAGGGAFREIPIHSAVVIAMELVHSYSEDFNPASVSEITRQPLRTAFDKIINQQYRRLGAGETNAKGYVFMNVLRTRLEAMGKDGEFQSAASATAHRTAREALEVLRARQEVSQLAEQSAAADRLLSDAVTSTVQAPQQSPIVSGYGGAQPDYQSTPDQNWMAQVSGTSMGDLMDMWPLFNWGDIELT